MKYGGQQNISNATTELTVIDYVKHDSFRMELVEQELELEWIANNRLDSSMTMIMRSLQRF